MFSFVLLEHDRQVYVMDIDFYDVNIFNRCESGNDILVAIPGWGMVHPLIKVIPVEWDHTIPYGLLYSRTPSKTVERFL